MAWIDENPGIYKFDRINMLDEAIKKLNLPEDIISKFNLIKDTLAKDVHFKECEIKDFPKFISIYLLIDGRDTYLLVHLSKIDDKVSLKMSTFSIFFPECNDWQSCTIEQFNKGLTFSTNKI